MHTLSLVIPAYNEEEAIRGTLEKAREVARDREAFPPDLHHIEVIVVSDGSQDRTVERARTVAGVKIIAYPQNRGYGRAIETGFAAATGDLLAFMDADGTCDPRFVLDLWSEMRKSGADIVLGSRLHGQSRMPMIRRIGNTLYALLLTAISGQRIRDTASGMRLLKRSLLPRIMPLPPNLSFTPAMSARCILDPNITIREIPMPYEERTGESKLNVLRDGLIFLQVILITALFYTPLRIFGFFSLLSTVIAASLPSPARAILLHTAVLLAACGLLFHFFSKKVLPDWPTSPAQRLISRALNIPCLLFSGLCAIFVSSIFPETIRPLLVRDLLLFGGGLALMLAAGRFIIRQMDAWQHRDLNRDALLDGVEIIET